MELIIFWLILIVLLFVDHLMLLVDMNNDEAIRKYESVFPSHIFLSVVFNDGQQYNDDV